MVRDPQAIIKVALYNMGFGGGSSPKELFLKVTFIRVVDIY